MRLGGNLIVLGAGLAASLILAACDEAEQDRLLNYEKGSYLGPKDQQLSDRALMDLRARTGLQRGD